MFPAQHHVSQGGKEYMIFKTLQSVFDTFERIQNIHAQTTNTCHHIHEVSHLEHHEIN